MAYEAYEALHSLVKELDLVLDHQNTKCFFHSNNQRLRSSTSFLRISCFKIRCGICFILLKKLDIQSLHEKVDFLSHFLEDFPREAAILEARLTNAAEQGREAFYFYRYSSAENDLKWEEFVKFVSKYMVVWICGSKKEEEELRQQLEKSINEIDSIYQEAKGIKDSNKNPSLLPRVTPIDKETTVGLEEDLIKIKGRLYGEPSELEIIPIIGMGGIGKTTLARYAYQDPSNIHHFDVRAWVTVSQNSSAKIILSSLLSSMTPSNKQEYKWMDKELLVVHVHRYLKKRRYLIAMDDMWDTNVWDDVRMAFPNDRNGSRIIITMRNSDIASYVDSSNHHHKIQLLSSDQSWRLLKVKVFGHENCPPELENIGRHISEKCKGLPLAILVIAGLLSKLERRQDSWEKIARNVSEAVNSSSDALSVSYMHLPPHLRHCFLYTACFPEDYEINVRTLIRLWLAEGFLISDESKDVEELGYEYLEDLDRRSLVMIEKKSYDGEIKTVKIHDVLRDLCIRIIRDENFCCIINEFQGSFAEVDQDLYQRCMKFEIWRMPQLRHLILLDGFIPHSFPEQILTLENLRTLSRMFDFNCSERVLQMIPSLKKLGIIYSYKGIYEKGWSEYSLKNLVHLHKLEKLSIYANPYPNTKNESISNNISFPLSLMKLNLSGCRFPWEDMTMIGSLPNLQVLKLMNRACFGTVWETNEGEFCQLKVLVIDSTDLHEWIADASAFASLKRVTLYECRSLREVPNVVGDIQTLELIEVDIRDSSVVASAKCIEEEQHSLGNDEMQVRLLKSRSWKFSSD